jgi:TRAP-type C4-dicarboxylate transport system permease small subunit
MRTIVMRISAFLALLAAACVLVMMFMTSADVASRWFTGRSIAGAQEVTESLMVAIVYLGIAYALCRREHVSVSVLTSRMPARMAAGVRMVGVIAMIVVAGWITWRTGLEALRSFQVGEVRFGLLQVPVWPARITIPIGFAAFVLQALVDLYDQFVLFRNNVELSSDATTTGAY